MDEILKTVVLGAPNVAVAIMALWWATRLIERMVAAQERLIDALMKKCAEVSALSQEVAKTQYAVKADEVTR